MAEKNCIRCATKNEEHYKFCKYCGAPLPVVDRAGEQFVYPNLQPANDNVSPESIDYDGVSGKELSAYIGKNADKIMPKMFAMQLTGKKTSFCVPVLVLGLLFGFFGMAFWFFSRKMVKAGAILIACAIVLTAGDALLNYQTNKTVVNDIMALYATIFESPESITEEWINSQANSITLSYKDSYNPVVSLVNDYAGGLILPVILGIYALGIYKRKALKEITAIKQNSQDDGLTNIRISLAGGRSAGLVFVPIAFMVLPSALMVIPLFL